MPLDRQSIEKRDFPIGRRGYEPEAVDAFLATLADEVDALQRAQRRRSTESLAQAASEQVRAIVEAAESTAAEIESTALAEATEIRSEAKQDAERTRNDAIDRAREQVGQVSNATSSMLERVDAMENELNGLLESLRTGANRLTADLALLEGNLGDLYRASGTGEPAATGLPPELEPDFAPEPASASAPAPVTPELESFEDPDIEDTAAASAPPPAAAPVPPPDAADAEPEPELEPEPAPRAQRGRGRGGSGGRAGNGDVEGARLIALNMALNGQSREETDRYLADNFDLANREELLDEVYSSVEG